MAIPNIGNIQMPYPIMPGAGVCKTPESILLYLLPGAPVGAAVTGPYALFGKTDNEVSNVGIERALLDISKPTPIAHRPRIISFAGTSVDDYLYTINRLGRYPLIGGGEVDLGHPSTGGLYFSYSLNETAEILGGIRQCRKETGLRTPVWVKLSPYVTHQEIEQLRTAWPALDFTRVPVVSETFVDDMLTLLASYDDAIQAVVFSSALPNVVAKKPTTAPFDGRGGLSGDLLKPISMKLIERAKTAIPNIDIIGCGSIISANDAIDYFESGASAVQCIDCKPRLFSTLKASALLEQYLGRKFLTQATT
ncbi:MAG: hypothetical protein WA082_02020 [Candidatus Moraniibacteriota bacterium]